MSGKALNFDESTFEDICFQSGDDYGVGDLVWARYKTFAWWPGRIATPAEVHRATQNEGHLPDQPDKKQLFVFFFASKTYGWCEQKNRLQVYSNALSKTQKGVKKSQRQSKVFKRAVALADDMMNGNTNYVRDSMAWVATWPTLGDGKAGAKAKKKRASNEVILSVNKDGSGLSVKPVTKKRKVKEASPKTSSPKLASPTPVGPVAGEDAICFVCNTGGELICCDVKECPRVYHSGCLRLRDLPPDDCEFVCPWHFCSACGTRDQHFLSGDNENVDFKLRLLSCPKNTVLAGPSRGGAPDKGTLSENLPGNRQEARVEAGTSSGEKDKPTARTTENPVEGSRKDAKYSKAKEVYFWYGHNTTLSFCPLCVSKQDFTFHLTEEMPLNCIASPKPIQYFTPSFLTKPSPIVQLNLIFERVWGFVVSNRLSRPFMQPLLASVSPTERYSLSKIACEPHTDLSVVGEKIRYAKYTSSEEFRNDFKAIAANCSLLCGGMYGPARIAMIEAARTVLYLCDDQLRAHRIIINNLEREIQRLRKQQSFGGGVQSLPKTTNRALPYPLRSFLCFPLLAPPPEAFDSEASLGSRVFLSMTPTHFAENGNAFPCGNEFSAAKFTPYTENAMKLFPEFPLWSLEAWDNFVADERVKLTMDADGGNSVSLAPSRPLDRLRTAEEMEMATIMATLEVPRRQSEEELHAAGRSDRHASSLLPDPVSQIKSLVEQQAHHMRAALMASRELQHAWTHTHKMFCGSDASENAGIVNIGDGNLIAEYRLANKNLKHMLAKVRSELVAETARRKELELENIELKQTFKTTKEGSNQ
jgi:hypothetical protein